MIETLEERLYKALRTVNGDVLRDGLRTHAELQEIKAKLGPQTKDEFWDAIKEKVGVELSRVAVCPGHACQLDMMWELYSFSVTNVLWVMNRGGSKTSAVGWCDALQAEYWPGWGSFTIGATKTQGDRKYEYILPLAVEGGVIGGKELPHVIRSTATETQYKNGSKVGIALGGSVEQANGPREPRLHRDEVEQMRDDTYKQAGNIPAGRKMRDGRYAPAQIIDTSTMKYAGGRVDKAMQDYYKAIEAGIRPRQQLRISCIFEAAKENPMCRCVAEEERRARLTELDRDPESICNCDTYYADTWPAEDEKDEEPEPRSLESVCQGRFFKSRGFKEFDDIQTLFLENDRETWGAEQECAQPATEGAYIRSYNQTRNGIKGYRPDPENGPIDLSVDWGTGDEAWVGWFQELERPVKVKAFKGDGVRTLPAGAIVVFGELFHAGLGNVELGYLVNEMEAGWILEFPGWHTRERYPDSANLGARQDWKTICGLETTSRIRKDFVEELKMVRTRVGKKAGIYVDIAACPIFDKSIRGWRQVNGREVHNEWCFVAGTMIEAECGETPIEKIIAGNRVWTREGLKSVIWSGQTMISETIVVHADGGRQIECTPGHRFWTERGWVRARDLTCNDILLGWRNLTSLQKRLVTRERSSSFAASGSHERFETARLAAPISRGGWTEETSPFIAKCGSAYGDRSHQETKSTTRTSTQATTESTILSVCPPPSTERDRGAIQVSVRSNIWIGFGLWLPRLCQGQRFVRLCRNAPKSGGESAEQAPITANTVGLSSSRILRALRSFARTTVSLRTERRRASIKSNERASIVGTPSWPTSIHRSSTARVRVLNIRPGRSAEPVFDLQVEDCPEFFADGVLVHNSHAMAGWRYYEHNRKIIERRLAKAGHNPGSPAVAEDENRASERETELGAIREATHRQNPLRQGTGEVLVVGAREDDYAREELGGIAAEDSPVRRSGLSMGGESDWRASFNRRER